jgi:FkbM family methyltransferase
MPNSLKTSVQKILSKISYKLAVASIPVVIPLVANSTFRRWLNAFYQRLNTQQRIFVHGHFAGIFRNTQANPAPGFWNVQFVGRTIRMPLHTKHFWQNWEAAVSIVGHDMDVKDTYASLITSNQRPDLFLDIGANYGTHSMLFLAHNIEAHSFEPNPNCHEYFFEICSINNVVPHLEAVAVGNSDGEVTLMFPEKATWLGRIVDKAKSEVPGEGNIVTCLVKQKTIDDYLDSFSGRKILMKIDTEGNELPVLQGAVRTLEQHKPLVIFECWQGNERKALFEWLSLHRYGIKNLPWSPLEESPFLQIEDFLESRAEDFIAIPR